jgi:chaperonin cofactor prefoldin
MDALQSQIDTLDGKVDILHRAIEQLSHRLTEVLDESRQAGPIAPQQAWSRANSYRSDTLYPRDIMMEHKDVLMDGDGVESMTQTPERLMSPELQIQRLTAQLTAAYNRIAALEEQLLARRVS